MGWMTDFLLFIFASIGMTKIIVDGKIAQPFRKWVRDENPKFKVPKFISQFIKIEEIVLLDIITCEQCCGFWSGLICGLFTILPWWMIVNKLVLFASKLQSSIGENVTILSTLCIFAFLVHRL